MTEVVREFLIRDSTNRVRSNTDSLMLSDSVDPHIHIKHIVHIDLLLFNQSNTSVVYYPSSGRAVHIIPVDYQDYLLIGDSGVIYPPALEMQYGDGVTMQYGTTETMYYGAV